mmetsp:Transcript_8136/g.19098  ORF Transcript_8136/g.19098 Transcript_8136/m.19098 type:complete len:622 (+) Transcript_8136:94-1959(+)
MTADVQGFLESCIPDPASCSKLSEVELQRACAPLYAPIAVDALSNLVLFVFFFNVALLTHVRGKLRSPMRALARLLFVFIKDYFTELWETVKSIPTMNRMPLAARLRCCGNIDKAISVVSTCVPLFAITRFLNFGNVNGARWIGYGLTCPFMQMELIILVAPIVPCFVINAFFTFALCFCCLMLAWTASVMKGDLYNGYFGDFLAAFDVDALDMNTKGWVISPALIGMASICLLQVPMLGVLYTCRGTGKRRDDMPDHFRPMLLTVMFTWALFPIWWLFSWEGASLFKDAKTNEMGFMILNMISKGTFIWQSSRMADNFEKRFPDQMQIDMSQVPDIVSRNHSVHRRRNSALLQTLEKFASDAHKTAVSSSSVSASFPAVGMKPSDATMSETTSKVASMQSHTSHTSGDVHHPPPSSATETMLKELLSTMQTFEKEMAETKKAAEEASSKVDAVAAAKNSGAAAEDMTHPKARGLQGPNISSSAAAPPFSLQALQSITPQPGPCGGFNPQQVGRGVEHGVGRYEAGNARHERNGFSAVHPERGGFDGDVGPGNSSYERRGVNGTHPEQMKAREHAVIGSGMAPHPRSEERFFLDVNDEPVCRVPARQPTGGLLCGCQGHGP